MHGRDVEIYLLHHGSQGSVVKIVTSLWAGQFGVQILAGASDFNLQNFKTQSRATQLPGQWVSRDVAMGIEWPGCEVDFTISSSKFKNEWSCTFTLVICFHGMYRNMLPFLFSPCSHSTLTRV
jgi:hypothetical protein